jgi:hypothetical protein
MYSIHRALACCMLSMAVFSMNLNENVFDMFLAHYERL